MGAVVVPPMVVRMNSLDLSERIGRRAARIEVLEWLKLQPPTIHVERVLRFIRETEAADLTPGV